MSQITKPAPSLTFKDFYPINNWELDNDKNCPTWPVESPLDPHKFIWGSVPTNVIDKSTGRYYLHESESWVSFKCTLVFFVTLIAQPFGCLFNALYRIKKIITVDYPTDSAFFAGKHPMKALKAAMWLDIKRILFTPVALVCLPLSALYGIVRPNDGKKLYTSFERALYGRPIFAAAFGLASSDDRYGHAKSLAHTQYLRGRIASG